MKTKLILLALVSAFSLRPSALLRAATTIDPANHYAYGANVGWVEGRGDGTNGAVIGEYVCSGYLYAANVGWINLGGGSPLGGIYYTNTTATNWGVNQDGLGNLRGYAYGANIGWVSFEATGAPKVDLATGKFSGYAWSANCGWISLSNAVTYVQTDTIAPGAAGTNGLPIAWMLTYFSTTNVDPNADPDGDGMSNQQEYLAGTNPLDVNDKLWITSFTRRGSYNTLVWTSKPTRLYRVERRAAFDEASPWETTISYDWPGWKNVGFDNFGPQYFYRIRAVKTLNQ